MWEGVTLDDAVGDNVEEVDAPCERAAVRDAVMDGDADPEGVTDGVEDAVGVAEGKRAALPL